jgi:hypothetical protein
VQVFENKVITKMFHPKKDEVSKQFRMFHNEKFSELNRSRNKLLSG